MKPVYDRNNKLSRRQSGVDISTMIYGKVPPQARDIEGAVLGVLMIERTAIDIVMELLLPECFYVEANQKIYAAAITLSKQGVQIEVFTIIEELKRRGELESVGGAYYVARLTNAVVSSANLEPYCLILKQKYIGRELIRISGETINQAYDETTDVLELLNDHERQYTALTTGQLKKTFSSLDTELVKRVTRIEELRHKQDFLTGIPSGFDPIDNVTHGWQNTDLIILAARPGVGKTALALNFARNAMRRPDKCKSVGFFSLEMSNGQLTDRLMAAEAGVSLEKIMSGNLDEESMKRLYTNAVQPLASLKIFVDDTASLSLFEIRTRARRMKRIHDVGLLIIDYLQLMGGSSDKKGNREQEISEISRGLKALAKELEVPIIALSQLSRKTEDRKGEKIPQLGDLRESGAIEQDADMVVFIYRPEYYDITANEMGESNKGETHIRIAKHRNGRLETVKLTANLAIQKFYPMQQDFGNGPLLPIGNPWIRPTLPYADDDNVV